MAGEADAARNLKTGFLAKTAADIPAASPSKAAEVRRAACKQRTDGADSNWSLMRPDSNDSPPLSRTAELSELSNRNGNETYR